MSDEQVDLAEQLLDMPVRFDRTAVPTPEACDDALAWLAARIDALAAERLQEIEEFAAAHRDEPWIIAANDRLTQARYVRQMIIGQRAELIRAQQHAEKMALDPPEAKSFKRLVKERLGQQEYLALWEKARAEARESRVPA